MMVFHTQTHTYLVLGSDAAGGRWLGGGAFGAAAVGVVGAAAGCHVTRLHVKMMHHRLEALALLGQLRERERERERKKQRKKETKKERKKEEEKYEQRQSRLIIFVEFAVTLQLLSAYNMPSPVCHTKQQILKHV